MIRVEFPPVRNITESRTRKRGRNTALVASAKLTTNCPFGYVRSPVRPWSATAPRSAAAISRPIGILPGGYVFQFPPPAVEARAVPSAGSAAGALGLGTGL